MLTYEDCINYAHVTDSEVTGAARSLRIPPMVACDLLVSAKSNWPGGDLTTYSSDLVLTSDRLHRRSQHAALPRIRAPASPFVTTVQRENESYRQTPKCEKELAAKGGAEAPQSSGTWSASLTI